MTPEINTININLYGEETNLTQEEYEASHLSRKRTARNRRKNTYLKEESKKDVSDLKNSEIRNKRISKKSKTKSTRNILKYPESIEVEIVPDEIHGGIRTSTKTKIYKKISSENKSE